MIKKTVSYFALIYFCTTMPSSEKKIKNDFDKVMSDLQFDIFAGHLVEHFTPEDISDLITYIQQPVDTNTLQRRALCMKQSVINFHKHQSFPTVFPANNIYQYLEALKNNESE